jgi:hypothetical protein
MPELANLIERVDKLGDAVTHAQFFQGDYFRATLCGLIREIPDELDSTARELCLREECPPADRIIQGLQSDIDKHESEPHQALILFPLLRVGIAIRAGEIAGRIKAH